MRAYCIAPLFGSWDARGTSRRIPPVTGSRFDEGEGDGSTSASADFFEEVVIEKAGTTSERGRVVVAIVVSR